MIKQGETKQVQKEMKKHKDIFEKKNMVSEKEILIDMIKLRRPSKR